MDVPDLLLTGHVTQLRSPWYIEVYAAYLDSLLSTAHPPSKNPGYAHKTGTERGPGVAERELSGERDYRNKFERGAASCEYFAF